MKSFRYFLVAVLLITGVKLIEVNFYHVLKIPSKETKKHKSSKPETKTEDQLDEIIESTQEEKTDTTRQADEAFEEPTLAEDPGNEVASTSQESTSTDNNSASNNTSITNTQPTGEAYFQDLKNSYLSPILASLPEGRSREDVVIRYYKHENDGNRAYALKRLGYYLHEREAEDNQQLASNSLYYGSDVDLRDIHIVAYTLLKEGMPLKSIKQSAFDWKFNSIEIGADSLVENNPIMSVADIEAFEIR